jgi:hypothetical protein
MKKYILPVLAISMLVAMPVLCAAQPFTTITVPSGEGVDIWVILPKALNWFFNIVLIIATIMMISAGYRYITAGGDETKVKGAMNNLIYALVGVGVAVLAKGLIFIISTFVGKPVTF